MNLKKSALSLAVAGALGATAIQPAVAGDVGAYGRLDVSLGYLDNGVDDATMGLYGSNSRFGFKGTEDLGNGLSAIYRYEFRVVANETEIPDGNRLSYVGLQGGWGTFSMGQQWGAYFNHVGTMLDPSYFLAMGSLTSYRKADTIKYAGGAGPVSFDVDLYMDLDGGAEDDLDGYAGAISFGIGPVTLAAAYENTAGGVVDDTNLMGLSGAWAIGKVATVRLGYEQTDDPSDENATAITLNGNMGFGGGWGGMVGFGMQEDDDSGTLSGGVGSPATDNTKNTTLYLMVDKRLSKRTRSYLEVRVDDPDKGEQGQSLVWALRHDY